ncbi:MAG: peptidase S41, partial [Muriicola sp.]|nr:peptidase S41 [Muriicola sp.]
KFVDFALSINVSMDFYQYEERIKLYLKSELAEQLFSPNISAKIKGEIDQMLLKVIDLDQPTWQPEKPLLKE